MQKNWKFFSLKQKNDDLRNEKDEVIQKWKLLTKDLEDRLTTKDEELKRAKAASKNDQKALNEEKVKFSKMIAAHEKKKKTRFTFIKEMEELSKKNKEFIENLKAKINKIE